MKDYRLETCMWFTEVEDGADVDEMTLALAVALAEVAEKFGAGCFGALMLVEEADNGEDVA